MSGPHPPQQPWRSMPQVSLPVKLEAGPGSIDDLIDLPDGSAVTFAEARASGRVFAWRWRGTGDQPFYPASTVKWVTAFMTLQWIEQARLSLDHVLAIAGEPPRTFRDLLGLMVVHSDNHAFNLLQEAVGLGETWEQMRTWGCTRSMIRRYFTRPHYSHSRPLTVHGHDGQALLRLAARPDPQLPLNTDDRPPPLGHPEQNLATTDDLVRVMAATLGGPGRRLAGLDELAGQLLVTGTSDVRAGAGQVAASPLRPAFVVLSKPGSWPPDGANAEISYLYDVARDRHLFLATYIQGPRRPARNAIRRLTRRLLESPLEARPGSRPADHEK